MARDFPCDLCQSEPAAFMVSLIANGDTLALGVLCVSQWAEAVTAAVDATVAGPGPVDAHADPADLPDDDGHDDPADRPAEAPQAPDDTPAGDWEDGYPQGRPEAAEAPGNGKGRRRSVPAETAPAAHE